MTLFFSVSFAEELFVYEGNFLQFPSYKEVLELTAFPVNAICEDKECLSFTHEDKRFYKTILLTSDNYRSIAIGTWSGGDCKLDRWEMSPNGQFKSQYPQKTQKTGIYSWSGKYTFTDKYHIEDAINNDGKKEWHEAKLFYLEKLDIMIYKGIRSLDGLDENGKEKYFYYEGPDYYYFRRCEVPNAEP